MRTAATASPPPAGVARSTHLNIVGAVWLALILETTDRLVDICAAIVIEFAIMVEDDNGHLTLTQDRQLHSLLQQPSFPLHEGDLALPALGDGPDVHFLPAHCVGYQQHATDQSARTLANRSMTAGRQALT